MIGGEHLIYCIGEKKILEVAFRKAPVSVLRIILVPGILAIDSVSVNRRQLIKGIIQLVTTSL